MEAEAEENPNRWKITEGKPEKLLAKRRAKHFQPCFGVMRHQRSRERERQGENMLSYNDLPGKSVLIYIYTYLWQVQREIGCETRRCF